MSIKHIYRISRSSERYNNLLTFVIGNIAANGWIIGTGASAWLWNKRLNDRAVASVLARHVSGLRVAAGEVAHIGRGKIDAWGEILLPDGGTQQGLTARPDDHLVTGGEPTPDENAGRQEAHTRDRAYLCHYM